MLDPKYIVKGPTGDNTLPEDSSVGKYITDCIKKRNPQDIFCINGITGESFTCKKILEQTFKTVIILRELGVDSDDVVAIVSENSVKYCSTLLAIYYIGAAANLLNPAYTTGELKRALTKTKPKVILCSASALEKLCIIKKSSSFIKEIVLMDEGSLSADIVLLDQLLETTSLDLGKIKPPKLDCKTQTALILSSSGTTGLPKSVMITHENCAAGLSCFGDPNFVEIKPGDATVAVLPFFHILGGCLIHIAGINSLKLVVLPSFQPALFLKCVETHKVTVQFAVPPMVSFLGNHPLIEAHDLSSLKTIVCAGGCLAAETHFQFSKTHTNACAVLMYGVTEAGVIALHPRDNHKQNSVGKLVLNAKAMVWQSDTCKNVGPMETGELCIRGPLIMKGYVEEDSNNVDEFGFYHTGDLGYYDEEGYIYIVGRIKELIKYKGYQVAPAELEDIIIKHKTVAECAVIGIPDERAGQLPTAFVVPHHKAIVNEKDIIDFLAERISYHKQLHGGVKFVNTIPKNAAGKVLRNQLLELYKTM